MKWFWFNLFILVMCGCRSSKVSSNLATSERNLTRFESNLNSYLLDTTRILRVIFDNSKFKFIETINIMEYDAESGKPVKETKAKREVVQDTDQVLAEEKEQAVANCNQLEVDHIIDVSKNKESKTHEEVTGSQESFGKWFGIVTACFIAIFVLCIWKKRVNKHCEV